MRIDGLWHLCDDGILRPVIHGEILAGDGSWVKAPLLVDSGADRTVFSADVMEALHLQPIDSPDRLSGVGGAAASVVVDTQLRLTHDQAGKAIFKGQFAGFTEVEALDMSVVGRDILNLFALIIDRQGDTICFLGQDHYYTIGKR
ncbi:MAG TPA: retropepsin-like aspartic protease [Gemmataceae bacterium]|nr:retropepsin-like aspartic protease [Gemmataceae bacterium]